MIPVTGTCQQFTDSGSHTDTGTLPVTLYRYQGGHSVLFVIYRFSLFAKSFRIRKLDLTNLVTGGILRSVRYK